MLAHRLNIHVPDTKWMKSSRAYQVKMWVVFGVVLCFLVLLCSDKQLCADTTPTNNTNKQIVNVVSSTLLYLLYLLLLVSVGGKLVSRS